MPRPRFAKLDPEKRHAILAAAMDEFAQHGYERASYNRIIERAGVSKGAMYYYFDDKEDLFNTVVGEASELALAQFGELPDVDTAEEFWAATAEFMDQALDFIHHHPVITGVMKAALNRKTSFSVNRAVTSLESLYQDWANSFLRLGQRVGAIRSDLPFELLRDLVIAIAVSGDRWVADHVAELTGKAATRLSRQLLEMFRGALQQPGPRPAASP